MSAAQTHRWATMAQEQLRRSPPGRAGPGSNGLSDRVGRAGVLEAACCLERRMGECARPKPAPRGPRDVGVHTQAGGGCRVGPARSCSRGCFPSPGVLGAPPRGRRKVNSSLPYPTSTCASFASHYRPSGCPPRGPPCVPSERAGAGDREQEGAARAHCDDWPARIGPGPRSPRVHSRRRRGAAIG